MSLKSTLTLLLLGFTTLGVLPNRALASGGGKQPPKEGEESKKEGKEGEEGKKEEKAPPEKKDTRISPEEAAMMMSAEGYIITPNYVHRWAFFPKIQAKDLQDNLQNIEAERGYASVVFFLASWCVTCQELTETFRQIEKKYSSFPVRFYYVFSHDSKDDIKDFSKEFKLNGHLFIASHDILKSFNNPELPTIVVGDRDKFILTRYPKATLKNLVELDNLLSNLVTY